MSERHITLACPGDPDRRSGGTIYDRRLADGLRERGWRVDWRALPASFPWPSAADLAATRELLDGLADGNIVLVDGLASGAMPDVVAHLAARVRVVALLHHPLALEAGLKEAQVLALAESERRALRYCRAVLVTSDTTRDTVVEMFAVTPERITVAKPGTDPAPLARGTAGGPLQIVAVGSVIPRKRLDLLVYSLAATQGRPWRLTIAGAADRSPEALGALQAAIDQAGVGDRVTIAGELGDAALSALLDCADLFVSSSAYEGFGMAIAEAVARGLPVVAVDGGAIGEWLDREAAILVPVTEPDGLARALGEVLGNAGRSAALRAGAAKARAALPTWAETARIAEDLLLRELAR